MPIAGSSRDSPLSGFSPWRANTAKPWEPARSITATIRAAEALRLAVGDEVDLLFDAHTMFSPIETVTLANALEPLRLFFYEDPVRPFNGQLIADGSAENERSDCDW